MADQLTHDDIRALLGAYALDAVEPDEAAVVAQHLESCSACRDEVTDHREVAALLASEPVDAPAGPWARIADQLHAEAGAGTANAAGGSPTDRPLPELRLRSVTTSGTPTTPHPAAPHRRMPRWATGAIAATVLLVAIVSIGALTWRQQHTIDHVRDQLASLQHHQSSAEIAARAMGAPGAQTAVMRGASGQTLAQVVVLRDGTAYLIPSTGLHALPTSRAYQLWGVTAAQTVSLGVLGSNPDITELHVPPGVTALAMTNEVASGVVTSTNAPAASGPLTTS